MITTGHDTNVIL